MAEQSQAPHTGTTIVACTYPGGVVLAADGRVSIGRYVSNRASNKIAKLSDNVFYLRSGSAPDTQAVAEIVQHAVAQLKVTLGHEPSVHSVATLVSSMNYQYKQLIAASLVAGWDEEKGGQVYGIPIGGTMIEEKWTTDGSGSTYIWGYLDAEFRDDFTREEAENFVVEAVALAMARDGSSGGIIRMHTVTKDGPKYRFIQGPEVPLFGEDLPFVPAPAQGGVVVG